MTAALDRIPLRIRDLVHCDVLAGVAPQFAGLHRYTQTRDGRSYGGVAHVAYPFHQVDRLRCDRRTTLVLPTIDDAEPVAVVHELGHVLDERLGFTHAAAPVSWYAATSREEAFAEAFTSWLLPGYAAQPDPATVGLLEALEAGP